MKTVKSIADLKQLAMQKGAAVEIGPSRFNSDGEKITRLERTPAPRPEPMPAPPREAVAPEVNVDMGPVAAALERAQQMQGQLLQSVLQQLATLQPGQVAQEWEFTVNRNPDGTLASIRARAIS